MKILTKKILRDIKYHKGRSLSIIIIIAIAMGLYTGLLLSYINAEQSFTQIEDDLNLHSARFVSQVPVDPSGLDITQFEEIKAWDTRLSLVTSTSIDGSGDSYTSPLIGIEKNNHPMVSDFELQSGNLLQNDDEILMLQSFLDDHDLDIGDTITINVGETTEELTVVGGVFSPEYIYKVNPKTGLPDISGVSPVWASLDFVQTAFAFPGINEILVRFNDDIHLNDQVVEDYIDEIDRYLETAIGPGVVSIELSQEGDQQMKEGDLGALDDFARVFGGVVLLIALFAIYDNISKLIANQRNYIGTMRALGGSKGKVARHYTFMAITLALIGIGIGIPFAWLIAVAMVGEYATIIGIPTPEINLTIEPVLEGFLIHLGLATLIAVITSMRAAGIKPREALSSIYITQVFKAKPIVERFLGAVTKFEPTTAIPIRNIFRNKRKTFLTIFTYAMSIVLMVSALAFFDSFNSAINVNYDERQEFDLEIYLTNSIPSQDLVDNLNQVDGIDIAEPFGSQAVTVRNIANNSKTTSIYAYQPNSQLRHFELDSGDSNGLIVSSLLLGDLDVGIGDSLRFLNTTMEISGISNELVSESLFLPLNEFQELTHLSNNATGAVVKLQEGVDPDAVSETLRNTLPVSVIISTNDVKDSIQVLIQGLFAIIGVMVLIGFLTVALFSFNTIVLEIISRENEFVNLKSLGASRRKILKIIVIQTVIVALAGSVLSIPLSYLITDQSIQAMMQDLMNIATVITPQTYIISIGSALLASSSGIIAAYKYVMNIDLVEAMRNRVSN